MNKFTLGMTAAGVFLAVNSSASYAQTYQRYMLSLENSPIAAMSSVAKSVSLAFARQQAIQNETFALQSQANELGVHIDGKLSHLGVVAFAEMTDAQAKIMIEKGYRVTKDYEVELLNGTEVFPGIQVEENSYELMAESIPWGIGKVEADESWELSTGSGVKTCIMDTGMDVNHADLSSNFVLGTRTSGEGVDPDDGHGHGTHVAGTIAANLNNRGIVGVAPEAELYIAAVFGDDGRTSESSILQGLDWCVGQGTRVANMSYGAEGMSDTAREAYQSAYDAGLVMVAATGNKGASSPIRFPAALETTIAVGATDSKDVIARFSQRGEELDLVAPGFIITSAKNGGGTQAMSGTSMATPHVVGAVAMLLSLEPSLTHEQVRQILRESADDVGDAGWDPVFGAGRLNVKKALEQLEEGLPDVPDQPDEPDEPQAPESVFEFTQDLLIVEFADSSRDVDGEIVIWSWDFGDGATSNEQSPTHQFQAGGEYRVSLTVTDDTGLSSSSTQVLLIEDGTIPTINAQVSSRGFWIFKRDLLRWDGARGERVDIYRNGVRLTSTSNDGHYASAFTFGARFRYQICESGSTELCSEEVTP